MPESPYREPTIVELKSTDPKTPQEHDRLVILACPGGVVLETRMCFDDGEEVTNLLRAVITLDVPSEKRGCDGKMKIHIARFNNEIGRTVFWTANCIFGALPGVDG